MKMKLNQQIQIFIKSSMNFMFHFHEHILHFCFIIFILKYNTFISKNRSRLIQIHSARHC